MGYRIIEAVIDASDPRALAAFYRDLLGARPRQWRAEWVTLWADPILIGFQSVPESKAVKNRCHLDFVCDDLETAAAHARSRGATQQGEIVEDGSGSFVVMQDPEGNEFCFVTGYPDDPREDLPAEAFGQLRH